MAICGIANRRNAQPVTGAVLDAMLSELAVTADARREQNSHQQFGLGAVSSTGSAFLWSSDSLVVACDAELYNRRQLLATLSGAVEADSPAALVGALYRQYGVAMLDRLRGPFSIAVWDGGSKTLLLAVDRFGVRPLSYAFTSTGIAFASYARGILASGEVEKKVNVQAIVDYFNYSVVPAPASAFAGIAKLEPGQYLLWREGGEQLGRYWEMRYPEDARGSVEELAEQLLSRMKDAVDATSADLEPAHTGCFLSGGTDSSSVAGLLGRIKQQPANTFSIGFAENRWNELNYAHLAAEHFHTRHTDFVLGPEDAYQIIPKIVEAYDEPFANSSAIPTYWCAKLAREHGMSVLLAGDGGDEIFGGNERYRTEQIFLLYQNVPRAFRRMLEPAVFAAPRSLSLFRRAQNYIRTSNTGNPERYCQWRLLQKFAPQEVLGDGMNGNGNGHRDFLAAIRRHYQAAPAKSELNRLLYVDVKMTLGDEDLPKVVRTAEVAGIGVRFPYLDHTLAEFTGQLPSDLKVRGLQKRYLFKRATRNLLPKAILDKKKHGFGLPIGLWLKTDPKLREMARQVLLDPRTYQRGYFRRALVERFFAELERDDTPYFGDLLWVFLMLELWHRRHMEGKRP